MYISEISPVSVKGAVGVSHQFMITFGILIAFVMSIKGVSFICTVIIYSNILSLVCTVVLDLVVNARFWK